MCIRIVKIGLQTMVRQQLASRDELILVVTKRAFLKSLPPSFLYTDFMENTEKSGFLRGFFRETQCNPCCPCPKKSLRNSL